MTAHALRIFAHAPQHRSLARPHRPPAIAMVTPSLRVSIEMVAEAPIDEAPIAVVEPTPGDVDHHESAPSEADPTPIAPAFEQQMLAILATAPAFGETIDAAYRRKERELGQLFGSVTRIEAIALHRRLSDPRGDDAVATHFGRLVVERRTRLLAVLSRVRR